MNYHKVILSVLIVFLLTCKTVENTAENNAFYEEKRIVAPDDKAAHTPVEFLDPFFMPTAQNHRVELSSLRRELTRAYCIRHYNLNSYYLVSPKMIVIHYTATNSLNISLNIFNDPEIPADRTDINGFGRVNIGVHFVVDRDGSVYSILPENMIGRHCIGFNYTAFGIENVGKGASDLTQQQIEANAKIVSYLAGKYPSVRFLIGHHEYMETWKPHFFYYKEVDSSYKPTVKRDPGDRYMKNLRAYLKEKYNLTFQQ